MVLKFTGRLTSCSGINGPEVFCEEGSKNLVWASEVDRVVWINLVPGLATAQLLVPPNVGPVPCSPSALNN